MIEKTLCLKLSNNKTFLKSLELRKIENPIICLVYDEKKAQPKIWLFSYSPYACALLNGYVINKDDKTIAFDINYHNTVIEGGA